MRKNLCYDIFGGYDVDKYPRSIRTLILPINNEDMLFKRDITHLKNRLIFKIKYGRLIK